MKQLLVAVAAVAASTAAAQTFVEWQLPAVMQPGDISVDSVVGDPFFLDPPTSSINRLSAGTVTQWATGPCVVSPADRIAVQNVGSGIAVYSTSFSTGRICVLDPSTNILRFWDLPFVVSTPETLSVDPIGRAWFSSTATGIPAVAFLDTAANVVQLWLLPSAIAAPGDDIAGLEFANSELSFSVTGSINQVCVINNPFILPSPTTCYSSPFNFPAPIRVNPMRHVFRIDMPSLGTIARLDPVASQWMTWGTPNPPDRFLSPVSANLPYFTDFFPAVERLDPSIAGAVLPAVSTSYSLFYDWLSPRAGQLNAPWGTFAAPSSNTPLNFTNFVAISTWDTTSSSGPITVGPGETVWVSETVATKIGAFRPGP